MTSIPIQSWRSCISQKEMSFVHLICMLCFGRQELLEKKAWEVAIAPIQSAWALEMRVRGSGFSNALSSRAEVGMNFFFLWMSGSCQTACAEIKRSHLAYFDGQVFARNLHNYDFGANLSDQCFISLSSFQIFKQFFDKVCAAGTASPL